MRIRLKRPRVYYFFLLSVVTVSLFVHFCPRRKPEKKENALLGMDFYDMAVENYGFFRVLDELCIEEGCFMVRDTLAHPYIKMRIERQLLMTEPLRLVAHAYLQVPPERFPSKINSRLWPVEKDALVDGSLDYAMIKGAIMSGGLPTYTSPGVRILIVGIGGGTITNYIHVKYPYSRITILEKREKMARFLMNWFHVRTDGRLKIYADETITTIRNYVRKRARFHVVFYNQCPMSYVNVPCPNAKDIPEGTIEDIVKLVGSTGAFVTSLMTNVVDATLVYEKQLNFFKQYFADCLLLSTKRIYNMVLSCSQRPHNPSREKEIRTFLNKYIVEEVI